MPDRKIRVMISSRCNDSFPAGGAPLSDLRRTLKREIEAEVVLGRPMFEVWINEDAPPADTSGDSLDVCLREVDKADLLIVLSNGNAGWAPSPADDGICHAELARGVGTAAGKVRLVSLGTVLDKDQDKAQAVRNARFQRYLEDQNFFRGGSVRTVDDAIGRVREAVFDGVQSLVQLGGRDARKGKYHTGEALKWSGLSFAERQGRIVEVLAQAMVDRGSGERDGQRVALPLAGESVLFMVHAIPGALAVAAARELVGRPFLRDFEQAAHLEGAGGPVHVIGCQKGATETQATALLGFPDATVVSAPYGIYVADPIQKVQFLFLQNCRDPSTTRHGVQRFFDWLTQSGEEDAFVKRAMARARIVRAIASENAVTGSS